MNKNKPIIIAVIQARMGSKRLANKVLKNVCGRSIIEWMTYRLSFSKELDRIVIATADTPDNDPIEAESKRIRIPCFRGSELDLISRYLGVAGEFGADAVVRLGGDCPLVDPEIVDKMIVTFKNNKDRVDLVANNTPPTYPYGMDVEIIPTKTLEILDQKISDPLYREWLTMNIVEHKEDYNIINVESDKDLRSIRLALDYPEDLVLIEKIFKRLHIEGKYFNLNDIIALVNKEPDLSSINSKWITTTVVDNVRKNEEFQNLKKKKHV